MFAHVLENVYTGVSSHFGVTNCNLSWGMSVPPNVYLKSVGHNRNTYRHRFHTEQKRFDVAYRRAERKYRHDKMDELDSAVTDNP